MQTTGGDIHQVASGEFHFAGTCSEKGQTIKKYFLLQQQLTE